MARHRAGLLPRAAGTPIAVALIGLHQSAAILTIVFCDGGMSAATRVWR